MSSFNGSIPLFILFVNIFNAAFSDNLGLLYSLQIIWVDYLHPIKSIYVLILSYDLLISISCWVFEVEAQALHELFTNFNGESKVKEFNSLVGSLIYSSPEWPDGKEKFFFQYTIWLYTPSRPPVKISYRVLGSIWK